MNMKMRLSTGGMQAKHSRSEGERLLDYLSPVPFEDRGRHWVMLVVAAAIDGPGGTSMALYE